VAQKKADDALAAKVKAAEEAAYKRGVAETQAKINHPEDTTPSFQQEFGVLESAEKGTDGKLPPDYVVGSGALGHRAGKLYREMEAKGEFAKVQ
jgi:hypothetical protein